MELYCHADGYHYLLATFWKNISLTFGIRVTSCGNSVEEQRISKASASNVNSRTNMNIYATAGRRACHMHIMETIIGLIHIVGMNPGWAMFKEETILFTVASTKYGDIPLLRKLMVECVEGKGRVLLDATNNTFSPQWQKCLQTIWNFVSGFLDCDPCGKDLIFSVGSANTLLEGYSASLPLSLLMISALTGERLQRNVFSTGCMYEPDGWISRGNPKAIKAKIWVAECLAESGSLSDQITLLIPYSHYQYQQTRHVKHVKVKNVLEAMKYNLPNAYMKNRQKVEDLISIEKQLLPHKLKSEILKYGNCLVIVRKSRDVNDNVINISSRFDQGKEILQANIRANYELISIYAVKESRVLFKHTYPSLDAAHTQIPLLSRYV